MNKDERRVIIMDMINQLEAKKQRAYKRYVEYKEYAEALQVPGKLEQRRIKWQILRDRINALEEMLRY